MAIVTSGLNQPVGVTNAGDGTNRLFVVQQDGLVRIVAGGVLQSGSFLDVRDAPDGFSSGGERGLLGLAFHPGFKTNRQLYVHYTNGAGTSVIVEYQANQARTMVDLTTRRVILTQSQPLANHNGGHLAFGSDGFLYIAFGDGGGAGDPDCHGQDRDTLLGALLRIDIDGTADGEQYRIPEGNPYKNGGGAPELWDHGLRNPWRFSFDRASGDLWIADVGQSSREEINREPVESGNRNYGWNRFEGTLSFNSSCAASPVAHTPPIAEYTHDSGDCSVTGGYVYRGTVQLDFFGHYVLGDLCSGRLWTIPAEGGPLTLHRSTSARITSFGEAESGEIYMTDHQGLLYRVIAPPFTDISSSKFLDNIMWIYYQGITVGCGGGAYCPTSLISRAEMASFLRRAFALPPTNIDYFTDDDDSPHEGAINALAHAGITSGCGPGRFCPDDALPRDQMASLLAHALDLPSSTVDFFDDDEGNTHEANINRIAAAGITSGCGAQIYCPSELVTRGQMAAMLHRAPGQPGAQ